MKRYIPVISLAAVGLMLSVVSACFSSGDKSVDEVEILDSVYMEEDSVPEPEYVKLKVNPIGGSLAAVFNDINNVQLPAAEALGIKPISSLKDAWNVTRPLVKIENCDEYYVEELTHSVPYLVPEASDLLTEIGRRFNDSLEARGGVEYKLRVTSVLRTEGSVSKLRRRNINATANSAHRYGTTFDISYIKFFSDSVTVDRSQEDLKNLLGEILKSLRDENRCYVKFERQQGCFHITARK